MNYLAAFSALASLASGSVVIGSPESNGMDPFCGN